MIEVKADKLASELEVEVPTEVVEENDADRYNAVLAVHQALHGKPVDFGDTVNHLLADKLQNAVDGKREEIARAIFNGEQPEVSADNSNAEEDSEENTVEPELTDDEEETPAEE